MKKKAKTAFSGVWRRVSQQRGVGVDGGAPGHVQGARGSERGVGEMRDDAREGLGRRGSGGKQEVAGRAPACVGHALGVLLAGGKW